MKKVGIETQNLVTISPAKSPDAGSTPPVIIEANNSTNSIGVENHCDSTDRNELNEIPSGTPIEEDHEGTQGLLFTSISDNSSRLGLTAEKEPHAQLFSQSGSGLNLVVPLIPTSTTATASPMEPLAPIATSSTVLSPVSDLAAPASEITIAPTPCSTAATTSTMGFDPVSVTSSPSTTTTATAHTVPVPVPTPSSVIGYVSNAPASELAVTPMPSTTAVPMTPIDSSNALEPVPPASSAVPANQNGQNLKAAGKKATKMRSGTSLTARYAAHS